MRNNHKNFVMGCAPIHLSMSLRKLSCVLLSTFQEVKSCRNLIFKSILSMKERVGDRCWRRNCSMTLVAAPLDLFLCIEFPNFDERFRQRLSSSRRSSPSRLVIDKRDNTMNHFHTCDGHVCIHVGWLRHSWPIPMVLFHKHRGVSWMLIQFLLRLISPSCAAYTSSRMAGSITQVQ